VIEIIPRLHPQSEALQLRGDGAALGRRQHAGAENQFRRVKGYQQLPLLARALEQATATKRSLPRWAESA
jgi:hypothetical protein